MPLQCHTFCHTFRLNAALVTSLETALYSGVAGPRPTRACALPSTLQALPSAISFESRDSTMDQTKINHDCSANNHKSVTHINATIWKPLGSRDWLLFHKSAYRASSGVRVN